MHAVYIGSSHYSVRLIICGMALKLSDYSLALAVTVLAWKLRENAKCHQNYIFKFCIQTGSAQQQ